MRHILGSVSYHSPPPGMLELLQCEEFSTLNPVPVLAHKDIGTKMGQSSQTVNVMCNK